MNGLLRCLYMRLPLKIIHKPELAQNAVGQAIMDTSHYPLLLLGLPWLSGSFQVQFKSISNCFGLPGRFGWVRELQFLSIECCILQESGSVPFLSWPPPSGTASSQTFGGYPLFWDSGKPWKSGSVHKAGVNVSVIYWMSLCCIICYILCTICFNCFTPGCLFLCILIVFVFLWIPN